MLTAPMRFLFSAVLQRASSLILWALVAGAMSATPVLAGPPFITDAPEPVDFRA
jgi:hypothetical protein